MNYDNKFGTSDAREQKDIIENLFMTSDDDNCSDNDDSLAIPTLTINLDDVDRSTKERANAIVERLSAYYFDEKYIKEHPYIPNKIAQEVDNIRRLLKMLAVNEKAQDTLITSIGLNAGKGTLYGSLTSLQNSMLSMQAQLNQLTTNLEAIFKEMQDNCEKTFEEKDKEITNEDGSLSIRGSREFIETINTMLNGSSTSNIKTNSSSIDDYDAEAEAQKILG